MPQSLGIAGGRYARSLYIFGVCGSNVLYLDPHILKPAAYDCRTIIETLEYHQNASDFLELSSMDPSMLFGFIIADKDDAQEFVNTIEAIQALSPVLSFDK